MENNQNIRKLVRVNLVRRGFKVNEAEDIHEAMDIFQEMPVDLVLLDMMQTGLSCVNVCIWIRARSNVPIIVLSAWLDQDLKVAALNAGANEFITKPFGLEELLLSVRILCSSCALSVNN